MSEAEFGLVSLLRDLEGDVRAFPFVLVGGESEVGLEYTPNDPLARDEFSDLLFGEMDVPVAIGKLVAQLMSVPFNLS